VDALAPTKRAIELEPRNYAAMVILGHVYEALDRPQEALAVFDRPEFRESPYIAETYASLGRRDDAIKVLNRLAERGDALNPQAMAAAYVTLGDKERGIEWLTKAFDQRSGYVSFANVLPALDPIRSDPRFKALVARLKLPN
jgi:tetratricopeptide (TPR) repeat protein